MTWPSSVKKARDVSSQARFDWWLWGRSSRYRTRATFSYANMDASFLSGVSFLHRGLR